MARQYLPDNFTTTAHVGAACVLEVKDENGDMLLMHDLRSLSNRFLNGERIDAGDKAAAGAAISHLVALLKSQKT